MNPHCRVKSYRLKTGGEVHVLHNRFPGSVSRIKAAADQLISKREPPDAWAIVGFWRDDNGTWACNMEIYKEAGMLKRMFPDAVRSLLERRINEEADGA